MIQIGIAGAGGWGRNLVRTFSQIPECSIKYICDIEPKRLAEWRTQLPATTLTDRFSDLLEDPRLQAVVLATPPVTHHELARKGLVAGKDVYVEKPLVLNVPDAEDLIRLAEEKGRVLMVGHLLEYHPVVNRLRQLIAAGDLGDVYYIYSQRVNLGVVRGDENALWSFAPHDISIVLYLLGKEPVEVAAHGQCYLQQGVEDVVFLTLNFGDRTMANVHVSWLDPHKIRKITIVGSRKMAVFDDLETTEKLKIFDKSADHQPSYKSYSEYITLRFGDITIPYMKVEEPLRLECLHFLECVSERKQPTSDGRDGLRVVRILERAQESLRRRGAPIPIELPS